ncbi:FxsA family protein [Aureimonas frigidaquae]|uniref:FxsA cytoplasmic membrane protein n=1 Tax=Aureimonas frigidaquae TaxID=424757 RepID=A0A0P0Z0R6_9HYPH|nr:FxsA family protein [Aureimonas frigidaquae]BAT27499.1 hypothetical protein [Aureimonas frigidaquae]
MPALLFLIGFIALPLVEIGVFIAVGSQIGIGWTLLLVILSFVLGIVLLRRQGFSVLRAAQAEARAGIVPEGPILHGAMIVLASILLMVPGFVTDVFGLLLFLPPVRNWIWRSIRGRVVVSGYATGPQGTVRHPARHPAHPAQPAEVIDLSQGEFTRRDGGSSPWSGADEDDTPPRTLH